MKSKKIKTRKKLQINLYVIIFGLILLGYAFVMLFPIAWGIMNSFKHILEFSVNPEGFPDFSLYKEFPLNEDYDNILGNYIVMFKSMRYKRIVSYYTGVFSQRLETHTVAYEGNGTLLIFFANSLIIGFAYSVIPAIVSCLAAYVCSQYKFKFSIIVYTAVLFVMATPIVGNTAASVNLMRRLNLYDSIFGLFIKCAGFYSMYFLVFYAYFEGMGQTYYEAAEIDGASQIRIMFSIAVPLSKTTIFSVIMVLFMASWNDYNTSLLMMPSYPTIAYGVFDNIVQNTQFNYVPYQLAALMLLALPSLTVFIVLKSKLMGNLSIGGVKE